MPGAVATRAVATRAAPRASRTSMGFRRTELPNGVRVLTEHLPGQRSASLGAWVGTGSRDEEPEAAGATHFLEHLVFKGTPTRSALQIAQDFDAIGGDLNAFTTKELTCFHARVLAKDVPMTLETIADMLQNATLTPDDVEAERSVVLEEIAMHEDTPDDIVYDVFHEALWAGHALGRRVQGYASTIEAMPRDVISSFYQAHYRPRGIVVSAAGAIEHDAFCDLVARCFPAARAAPPSRAGDAPVGTTSLEIVRRDIEQVHLVYGTPGLRRSDERRWAIGVLNVALGGGMSSRLFQEIREKRGLAYAIGSSHQGFADAGAFTVYAGCSPERAHQVLTLIREQVDAVTAAGITDEELERARTHLRGILLVSLDDSTALMSHLGRSELYHDEVLETEDMIRRIEAVTADDVREVAGVVLADAAWSLAAIGPAIDADLSGFVGEAA
ncbi:MAG TPA: pitrilysin family protein [Actinomycetota bacterium]